MPLWVRAVVCALLASAAHAQELPANITSLRELVHDGQVTEFDLSSDGNQVVSVSLAQQLFVWDTRTGEVQWQKKLDRLLGRGIYFGKVRFSPDGRLVAAEWNGEVILFSSADGTALARLGGFPSALKSNGGYDEDLKVAGMEFSPDGQRFVAYNRRAANIYVIAPTSETGWLKRKWLRYRGEEKGEVLPPALAFALAESRYPDGGLRLYLKAFFSTDGHRLIAIEPHRLRVWSADSGAEVFRAETTYDGLNIGTADHVSRTGSHAATCAPDGVVLVSVERPSERIELKRTVPTHFSRGENCAFSPDGTMIASWVGDEYPIFNVNVWDLSGKEVIQYGDREQEKRPYPAMLAGQAFSGDSKRLATIDEVGTLRVFGLDTGVLVAGRQGENLAVTRRARSTAESASRIRISTDRIGRSIAMAWGDRIRLFEVGDVKK